MTTHRLLLDFATTILAAQFGITRELAQRRLLDAAEALAACGDECDLKQVLALAVDLHQAQITR